MQEHETEKKLYKLQDYENITNYKTRMSVLGRDC